MRKLYKIIGGMLIGGFLITGIGSGIVFAEYSALEYGGKTVLEGSEYFSKSITYRVPEKETAGEKQLQVSTYYPCIIVEDSSVPKDEIKVTVNYLSDNQKVNPEIKENMQRGTEEEPYAFIHIECDYDYDNFRDMMRVKEPLLADLKNHRISEYQLDGVENVELHINPKADFSIRIN